MTVTVQADNSSFAALHVESVTITGDRHGTEIKIDGTPASASSAHWLPEVKKPCSSYNHTHRGNCRCLKLCKSCRQPESAHRPTLSREVTTYHPQTWESIYEAIKPNPRKKSVTLFAPADENGHQERVSFWNNDDCLEWLEMQLSLAKEAVDF